MKKLIFLSALITSSFFVKTADAQVGVHFNINLGQRPVYVPVPPPAVVNDYYYLPDAGAYYSVPERVYYYQDGGRWISNPRLAGRFRDYDYSRMRHFAINEPRPYLRNDYYRSYYNNPQFAARANYGFGRSLRFNNAPNYNAYGRNNFGRNDPYYDHHDNRGWHNGYGRY